MNTILLVFISGFSIGILGSFHCIGMCGPLALALPIHHLSSFFKALSVLLYNLGRAITYSFMGMVFGIIGQSFNFFFKFKIDSPKLLMSESDFDNK